MNLHFNSHAHRNGRRFQIKVGSIKVVAGHILGIRRYSPAWHKLRGGDVFYLKLVSTKLLYSKREGGSGFARIARIAPCLRK